MIILQILLIPLVIFTMLGFVFVISLAETGQSTILQDTELHESRIDESISSCASNTCITYPTTSAR